MKPGPAQLLLLLLYSPVEQVKCLFFSAKQINRVVWGVFRVLRWAFACGCDRWFFVLIEFMLWVRFLIVFVAFCCCLLCFGVFLGFAVVLDIGSNS